MREGEREGEEEAVQLRGCMVCVYSDPSHFAFVCDNTREEKNLSPRQEQMLALCFYFLIIVPWVARASGGLGGRSGG